MTLVKRDKDGHPHCWNCCPDQKCGANGAYPHGCVNDDGICLHAQHNNRPMRPFHAEHRLEDMAPDDVNHPSHYTQGGIECIDALQAALSPSEFQGFCRGNAMKYLWRMGLKGYAKQDMEKAIWYINRCLQTLQ